LNFATQAAIPDHAFNFNVHVRLPKEGQMLGFLSNMLSIALGVVLGTVIAWVVSYFLAKRMLPSIIRMLYEKREALEALRTLMERLGFAE